MTFAFPGLSLIVLGFLVAQRFDNAGFVCIVAGVVLVVAGAFA